MYGLIGAIHGHTAGLRQLLEQLDYAPDAAGASCHPGGQQAVFLGGFIDQDPAIGEALHRVRGRSGRQCRARCRRITDAAGEGGEPGQPRKAVVAER